MSVNMRDRMLEGLGLLRYEPTEMRIRINAGDREIADTTRAMLVWEPRRVVPSYAVPVADLRVEVTASPVSPMPLPDGILHPGIPFAAHSCPGEMVDLVAGGTRFARAGFRPEDPALTEYAVLDFWAFDGWFGEDERLVAHPRDPYHRVDIRASSRRIRLEVDGVVLAESPRPTLVFETSLPVRFYLPREDILAELVPSDRRTECAYKGEASYFSVQGHPNLAWTYPTPLSGATGLAGLIAFFDDNLEVFLDGERRRHRRSAVSEMMLEEFDVK